MNTAEIITRQLRKEWTRVTREGSQDDIKDYIDNVLIYDVLPPPKYESVASY